MAAWRGFLVLLFGLGLAALLDAEGLRKQAETQPAGLGRTLAMDVTRPLVSVSRTLHLTAPRHAVQVAIGSPGGADAEATRATRCHADRTRGSPRTFC